MKVYTDIAKVKAEWDKFNVSDFIHSSFLEAFYINHPNIKHLFVISKDIRLYANIFKLSFSKTISYLRNKRLGFFVKFLNFHHSLFPSQEIYEASKNSYTYVYAAE